MKSRHSEAYFNRGLKFEDRVEVRLEQWIPPSDEAGSWKDTGRIIVGTLVNGPESRLRTPDRGYWYVLPDNPAEAAGNAHPLRISETPFDPYAEVPMTNREADARAGSELCRFVVGALHEALQSDTTE